MFQKLLFKYCGKISNLHKHLKFHNIALKINEKNQYQKQDSGTNIVGEDEDDQISR